MWHIAESREHQVNIEFSIPRRGTQIQESMRHIEKQYLWKGRKMNKKMTSILYA